MINPNAEISSFGSASAFANGSLSLISIRAIFTHFRPALNVILIIRT